MKREVQKITLSSSRDIPFNKLVLSQANVRRVKAGLSIEELAEDIARRTLLQSLNVRPVLDAQGVETGSYEVPAGGRRFRALELLVKQKRLSKTTLIPCVVRDTATAILAEDDSLAENMHRAPLHPLDQFRAFQDMRVKGMTEEEIAAAFFVSVQIVKQRLRLASVSPALLDFYAEDGMTLDQLMAFTVSTDHARQEQVWNAIKDGWSKEPYLIRRMLTETTVRATDKRAVFVGLEAYEAAGGVIVRDLFQSDDGGWLQDAALLDRLATEKLKASAETIAAEGWKWIEVAVTFPYDVTRGLRELRGEMLDLSPEDQAAIDALNEEYRKLEAEYQDADEVPDDIDQRLGEIESSLAAFENRPVRYRPEDIARAGVFISIAHDGSLDVDRGYVRAEDEAPEASTNEEGGESDPAEDKASGGMPINATPRSVITVSGPTAEPEEDGDDDAVKPLPDRLITELTAHRTLALRNALADHPQVALTALLHKLVSDTFYHGRYAGALEASIRSVSFPAQDDGLKDSPAARAFCERQDRWAAVVPEDDAALWNWLVALDETSRMDLLAHCVGSGVNALHEKPNPYGGQGVSRHRLEMRLRHADRFAIATGLDMIDAGWRPTVGNYLGRVTKARILEAVVEGAGERAARLIEHLKKDDMAREAERLLAETDWLPEPLRLMGGDEPLAADSEVAGAEALPDFLTNDKAAISEEDYEDARAIAAE